MGIRDKIHEHFSKNELGFDLLLEMIEAQLGEKLSEQAEPEKKFSAARFYKTALKSFKPPTEQAGKFDSEERKTFQKYITRNIKGNTLGEKIASINAVVEGVPGEGAKISEIMSSLGAIKMLQQTLDDFNESTAGFLFEAFLSGLLRGEQVTEKVGGSLPIEDCMFFVDPKTGNPGQPVSLKLLNYRTTVDGSLENLLSFFMRPEIAQVAEEKGIEYIVATKTKKNELDMYSFNIKPSTFFYWIEEKNFDLGSYPADELELLQEFFGPWRKKSPEEINDAKENWERFFRQRATMFGLEPSEVTFKYDWKTSSYWRNVVKPASSARNVASRAAEIMLSPDAKNIFAKWLKSDFDLPKNLDAVTISPELEAEFRSEDAKIASDAAIIIAKIGKNRLISYFDSIEGTGEKVREAPVHIQRWYAANKSGSQHAESDVIQKMKALVKDGSAESIIKWAGTLKGLLKRPQFEINPIRVRSEGILYGTVNVNKNQIYRTLRNYSAVLETTCAPIYEELEKLSQYINGYFIQNRAGDAFKAASSAEQLHVHTKELAKETEE